MKKILVILLVGACLFFAVNISLNNFLTPKIKNQLEKLAKDNFNKELKIESIKINILGGLVLEGVQLYDTISQDTFLSIEKIKVIPFYPTILSSKKIILLLETYGSKINLQRNVDGKFNITAPSQKNKKSSFLIKTIKINDLVFEFNDKVTGFKKILKGITLFASTGFSSIHFKIIHINDFDAKGTYYFNDESLKANLILHGFNAAELSPYIKPGYIEGGDVKTAQFKIEGKKNYELTGKITVNNVLINYQSANNELFKDMLKLNGDFVLSPRISFNRNSFNYDILGQFKDGQLNIPAMGTLNNIRADFNILSDKLSLNSFEAKMYGNSLQVKGVLEFNNNKRFYLETKTEDEIATILDTLQKLKWLKEVNIKPKGKTALTAFLKGNLQENELNYLVTYNIFDGAIEKFNLSNINARGLIDKNEVKLEGCSLNYKNIPISAKGSWGNFSNPICYLQIKTSCPLEKFVSNIEELKNIIKNINNKNILQIPENKEQVFQYNGPGDIEIEGYFKGDFTNKIFNYNFTYKIKSASLEELKDIEAEGRLTNKDITLEKCLIIYKDMPFILKGLIKNYNDPSPMVALKLKNPMITASFMGSYSKNQLTADRLYAKSGPSWISAKGNVSFINDASSVLTGRGKLNSSDLLKITDTLKIKIHNIEKIKPAGNVNVKFLLYPAKKVSDWVIKIFATTDSLNLFNIDGQGVRFIFVKDDKSAAINKFHAKAADGKIAGRLSVDLTNEKTTLKINISDVELSKIRKQLSLRKKRLAGKLYLDAEIENTGFTDLDKMNGYGIIKIKEGDIWDINLLKGLGKLLFITDFEEIKFNDGSSNLTFKDDKVFLNDIQLNSLQMNLRGNGNISTKGDLDFLLLPEFNPLVIASADGLKKHITNLLGRGILSIKIGGNVKKPHYKVKPGMINPVKGVKDFIQGIFSKE